VCAVCVRCVLYTTIGSIKQEEDVYRYWHWAVDAFPADNGLLFDVFDESCLEARLCRSYAPPPPSVQHPPQSAQCQCGAEVPTTQLTPDNGAPLTSCSKTMVS